MELGRPALFRNRKTLEAWSVQMDGLYRESGLDFEGFKWFLIWALRPDDPDGARFGNDFTAKNLRMAKDPMSSLVKQFSVAFTIFGEKAEKILPLLQAKREQEEADALCEICSSPAPRGKSLCRSCFDESAIDEPEQCEKCEQTALSGTSLCSDCLDKSHRNRMRDYLASVEVVEQDPERRPGESLDEWIERHFAPIRDDLRCPHCGYSDPFSDDERTAWCSDCAEERWMDIEDDLELLLEVPTVSCLTNEWDCSTVLLGAKARSALLRHAAEMYNQWLAAPVDGSRVAVADLQWAQQEDLAAIVWIAALNRDGATKIHFPAATSAAPRFTKLAVYREVAHVRVMEQHQQWS
jgi:frataxin-like iron-binding protein CyaY